MITGAKVFFFIFLLGAFRQGRLEAVIRTEIDSSFPRYEYWACGSRATSETCAFWQLCA